MPNEDYSEEDIKVLIITGLTIVEAITDPVDNVYWFALTKTAELLHQQSAVAWLEGDTTTARELEEKITVVQDLHTDMAATALLPGFRLSDSQRELVGELALWAQARALDQLKANNEEFHDLLFPTDDDLSDGGDFDI